jgi:hypothetical protein
MLTFEGFTQPCVTDLVTWVHDLDIEYVPIRYCEKKNENDTGYSFGRIRHWIELPNGDILLGIQDDGDGKSLGIIEYFLLSEIRISVWDNDFDTEWDDEDLEEDD